MILSLAHKQLLIYRTSINMATECFRITSRFPQSERYNLIEQINRAATSVVLNIAEGASRKSAMERRRYYEIARGSIIEIDAALELSAKLQYLKIESIAELEIMMKSSFSMLSKMISTLSS
jgi:four helix bundle protein